MDVGASLIVDRQPAEPVEPSQGALDSPAVPAQPSACLQTPSCDSGRGGAGAALGPAATVIVRLACIKLLGPPAPMPPPRHGVERRCQHRPVMAVGRAQAHAERHAPAVDHDMALRARLAAIRQVRAGLGAPLPRPPTRCLGWLGCSPDARLQLSAQEARVEGRTGAPPPPSVVPASQGGVIQP